MTAGPFGLQWLRPQALLGVELPPFAHAAYWSLLLNVGLVVGVSLLRPSPAERLHAERFLYPVAMRQERPPSEARRNPLFGLLVRVFGATRAEGELHSYERMVAAGLAGRAPAFAEFVESRLAGVIGRAAANLMVTEAEAKDPLRDPATGLPNRHALVGELADRLAIGQRSGHGDDRRTSNRSPSARCHNSR